MSDSLEQKLLKLQRKLYELRGRMNMTVFVADMPAFSGEMKPVIEKDLLFLNEIIEELETTRLGE